MLTPIRGSRDVLARPFRLCSRVTCLYRFFIQPEVPIPVVPVTRDETAGYIEPHLVVMTQPNQTSRGLEEPWIPSPPPPNTDIEDSKSLGSSTLFSPPISESGTPLLKPSKTDALPRKGVLRKCQYCRKYFSPSELK